MKINGIGDHHVMQNKLSSKRQISRFLSYVESTPKEYNIRVCVVCVYKNEIVECLEGRIGGGERENEGDE
jgi:hypothetical protein